MNERTREAESTEEKRQTKNYKESNDLGAQVNRNQQNSGWLSNAVGVSSRSEFLDSTVWSNVFNAVSEGSFVEKGFTTTTTRLLLPTF